MNKENLINKENFTVENIPTIEESVKYLKTLYRDNYERFESRFLKPSTQWLSMNEIRHYQSVIDTYIRLFHQYEPYTYKEAFNIKDRNLQIKVFAAINVVEMIENLGTERISVKGVQLINKVYDNYTKKFREEELHQIYELHQVNGKQLGVNTPIFAIKCWCTSTNKEHWLWTDANKNSDVLELVANTCVVYKPMLGKIKHIIRQGDVFLFEMLENVVLSEKDEKVKLDAKTYFSLLKSQS